MIEEVTFWGSALLLGYIYLGYPALVFLVGMTAGRPAEKALDAIPTVTVVTAAFNEAEHIAPAIRNKLEQDYPTDRLDVIVVSDASTDGTDDLVRAFGSRVRLIRQEPRAGKTAALNIAVDAAPGDIIVFADANSMYARDAIRHLASNFADPKVGYVTGNMVYTNPDGSLIGDGCSAYMRYENHLRRSESRLGTVIGVDGGIDAVRRALFVPMRPDQLPDFVLPLTVAEAGYRVVFEPAALLQEQALATPDDEYRMRVRVALRALWAIWDKRALLNPLRWPLLSLQIVSHKILRYFAFVPLALALLSTLALSVHGGFYAYAAAAQIVAYALALLGWRLRGRGGALIGLPYYFALLNFACAHATLKFLVGERQAVWAPRTG